MSDEQNPQEAPTILDMHGHSVFQSVEARKTMLQQRRQFEVYAEDPVLSKTKCIYVPGTVAGGDRFVTPAEALPIVDGILQENMKIISNSLGQYSKAKESLMQFKAEDKDAGVASSAPASR